MREPLKSTYLTSHIIMVQYSKYFNSVSVTDNISVYPFKIQTINAKYNVLLKQKLTTKEFFFKMSI